MRLRLLNISTLIFLLFIAAGQLQSANKTFTGVGSFSVAARWNGGTLPVAGDNLRINGTCTYDNNPANNLIYGTLNVGFSVAATLQWVAGGTNTLNVTTVSSTTAGSILNMTNGGTLQIRTSWATANQTFTPGTGTILWNVTGANSTLPAGIVTYNRLTTSVGTQTVTLGVNTAVSNNLNVAAGTFRASTFNITNNGTTTVNGTYYDQSNTGTNIFTGAVTVNPGGAWNSTTETTLGGLVFRGGIVSNGASFAAGAVTFDSNPQTLSGATTLNFASAVTVTGVTVTNGSTVTMTAVAAGSLTGTGTWTQGVNGVLNYAGSTITIAAVNFNTNLNTVIYNRGGNQTIFAATYRHLTLSTSGTKSMTGAVVVNNDLIVNTGVTLNPIDQDLTVNGSTTIAGTLSDSNILGTTTFQNTDISGGTLNSAATGTVIVNGALTMPTGSATIGRMTMTVNGTTTVGNAMTLTLSNNNGIKIFVGLVTVNASATWLSTSITTAGNLVFKGGITNNGTSFSAGVAAFTTNSQAIGGVTALSFSRAVTVTGVTLTNNTTVNLTSTAANGLTGTGGWTQGGGSVLNIATSAANISTANFSTVANTVNYNGNVAQSIYNSGYNNLSLTTGAASINKTIATSPLVISGDLALTNGAGTVTLNQAGRTVNLTGNLSGNGALTITTGTLNIGGNNTNTGTFTPGTGLVRYNGSAAQVVRGTTYNNLTIAGSNTKTLSAATVVNSDLNISSTLAVSASNYSINLKGNWTNTGTFTCGTGTVTLSGVANQTITNNAGETFNHLLLTGANTIQLAGAISMNGNLSIGSTSILDVTVSDYAVNVKGNWTNDGSFLGNTGTVTLNGLAAQTISGADTATFHNLTLTNSAGAGILSPQNLRGVLQLNSGTLATNGNLTLTSDATYTGAIGAIAGGADITGNVTMQRYAPGGKTGWAIIGAPFSSAMTLSDWDDDIYISCSTCPDGSAGGFTSIYTYNETVAGVYTAANSYVRMNNVNDPVTSGKGFYVYLGTAQNLTAPITWDVTGTVTKFNQSINLSYTNHGTPADDGWNMIANPYPSPISWSALKGANGNVDDAIYAWNADLNAGAGAFATCVGGVSTPTIGAGGIGNTIPSGQGFFVHATAVTSLSATESIKVNSNPTFLKTSEAAPVVGNVFRLFLDGANGMHDETVLHFNVDARSGFDSQFDAYKLLAMDQSSPYIASEMNNSMYAINGLPALTQNIHIPIKVITSVSGAFSISPIEINNLPSSACVYLQDLLTGTMHDLRTGAYNCYLYDTTSTSRFVLDISYSETADACINGELHSNASRTLSNKNEKNVEYYIGKSDVGEQFVVVNTDNNSFEDLYFSCTDMMGRTIFTQKIMGSGNVTIQLPADLYSKGIYIATLTDNKTYRKSLKWINE